MPTEGIEPLCEAEPARPDAEMVLRRRRKLGAEETGRKDQNARIFREPPREELDPLLPEITRISHAAGIRSPPFEQAWPLGEKRVTQSAIVGHDPAITAAKYSQSPLCEVPTPPSGPA